jgi:serine/threonine protein kinase
LKNHRFFPKGEIVSPEYAQAGPVLQIEVFPRKPLSQQPAPDLFAHLYDHSDSPLQRRSTRRSVSLAAMDGVDRMHQIGWIHRDLKPEHFLVNTSADLKIIDFGFARPIGHSVEGEVEFTPTYASPGHRRGDPPIPKHDIYALREVFRQLLPGQMPALSMQRAKLILALRPDWPTMDDLRLALAQAEQFPFLEFQRWVNKKVKQLGIDLPTHH